jgi:hypothetical protein
MSGRLLFKATTAKTSQHGSTTKGITFARATREEADRSDREAEFARATATIGWAFKEGEIGIVSEPSLEYGRDGEISEPRRRVHKLDRPSLAGVADPRGFCIAVLAALLIVYTIPRWLKS